jgi:hypothetical protein
LHIAGRSGRRSGEKIATLLIRSWQQRSSGENVPEDGGGQFRPQLQSPLVLLAWHKYLRVTMSDISAIRVFGSNVEEFGKSLNAAFRALPLPTREHLQRVLLTYAGRYGIKHAYERMNDRTVSQILAEFHEPEMKTVASGELDGLKYKLYDPQLPEGSAPDTSDG